MVVRDEPGAVDLPKARRPPEPEIDRAPGFQRAADPIEAVAAGHVIARSDREVANLVTERTLVDREGVDPVLPFAPAPTGCSGGTMSNETMSGA